MPVGHVFGWTGLTDLEKLNTRVKPNQNVATEATHMPESGLLCMGKANISVKFSHFWTPPVGHRTLILEVFTGNSFATLQKWVNYDFKSTSHLNLANLYAQNLKLE